jgi:hypothetical protein
MAPSLLAQRKNSRCSPFSTRHRGLGSGFRTEHGTKIRAADYLCTIEESVMGLGRGALLWMLGVPLPIVILLALFWHN